MIVTGRVGKFCAAALPAESAAAQQSIARVNVFIVLIRSSSAANFSISCSRAHSLSPGSRILSLFAGDTSMKEIADSLSGLALGAPQVHLNLSVFPLI